MAAVLRNIIFRVFLCQRGQQTGLFGRAFITPTVLQSVALHNKMNTTTTGLKRRFALGAMLASTLSLTTYAQMFIKAGGAGAAAPKKP